MLNVPQNYNTSAPKVLAGQIVHIVGLALLLVTVFFLWEVMARPHGVAFWVAIAVPMIHQIYVLFAWRLELRASFVSRTIGFNGYLILFFAMFFSRFITLGIVSWFDNGSLGLHPALRVVLTVLLLIPAIYTAYSVRHYFGFARAAGADHFDDRYRNMPFVKEGIFRFTANAMYMFAFFFFWAIAVGFNSVLGLLIAAYAHIYIWVHFFATEKPDLEYLYPDGA